MKNIIVFILIINFFSCSYENEFDQEVVTIDIDLNKSIQGKLSDQFESPEYILLDFSDNNPLINLYNIIFKDEMIFIRDNRSNNLFIFNENGKVVDIINANGMGPGEFSQMDDFQVTEDRIFIQDTYLHKQLEFDRSGKFIKEIKNRYNNTNFYVGEKYSIYFLSYQTDFKGYNFVRKDNFNGKEDLFYKIDKELENSVRVDNLNGIKEIKSKNLLYYSVPHATKMVLIDKFSGYMKNTYFFNFGKYNLDNKYRSFERQELRDLIRDRKLVRRIDLVHSYLDKYLLFIKQGFDQRHYIFIDHDLNVINQWKNFENDIDGMPYVFPWTGTDNCLIFRFHSSEFYNEYFEVYRDKNVKLIKGNIHEFFQLNKNNLKEDKWVLVKLKIK